MRKSRHCFGCLQTLNNWNECQKIGIGKMLDVANLTLGNEMAKPMPFFAKIRPVLFVLSSEYQISSYTCLIWAPIEMNP